MGGGVIVRGIGSGDTGGTEVVVGVGAEVGVGVGFGVRAGASVGGAVLEALVMLVVAGDGAGAAGGLAQAPSKTTHTTSIGRSFVIFIRVSPLLRQQLQHSTLSIAFQMVCRGIEVLPIV